MHERRVLFHLWAFVLWGLGLALISSKLSMRSSEGVSSMRISLAESMRCVLNQAISGSERGDVEKRVCY